MSDEYSDLEYATRLDGTTMPAPRVLPNEFCWCGGEVGARSPGDHLGLGCLANITHNWNAASQESQDLIEAEQAYESAYDCRNCEDSDPGSLHAFDEHCGADKCEAGCMFFAPHPSHPCRSRS